jgi:DNA modification methylase
MTITKENEVYSQINIRDFNGNLKTFTIYDKYQDYQTFGKEKIIIVDCSPVFESNNQELIKNLDLILISTTLNPLRLSKNGDVTTRTITRMRQINQKCFLTVVINNFIKTENTILNRRIQFLISRYKKTFWEIQKTEEAKFDFLNPDEGLVIRTSDHLLGLH